MAVQAHAVAKYVRTTAQKAGLVMDLIRGRDVNTALATLKEGFGGDVERLYVNACYADQGPSQKRIRPAPMGRAFRVVKRTAHLTVQVTEKPSKISAAAGGEPKRARKGAPKRAATSSPKRSQGAKTGAKKSTAKSRAAAATE